MPFSTAKPSMNTPKETHFTELGLQPDLLQALNEVGYETPSPVQAQTIPHLLRGKDLLGQAQTGTGKTAAFALPLLSRINLESKAVQVLILAPTRELAIQVAEALQKYAKHMKGFKVLPVYGGQDYKGQIRSLTRGVHVVVGTPGRVMDHMRRGTLKLDRLSALVLDEADEMLRMGFIDDVEWILEQTPDNRQIALFSATMPSQIKRIASKYLNKPVEVIVKSKAETSNLIRQRFVGVTGRNKLEALTRILEVESFGAMIIFVRTKTLTVDLADKLEARGYACAALNGDIPQNQRERTIDNLKKSKIDIVIATDVAARGLDVERISHVINYDIPSDVESYVHRIGRTGRAGREGDAILFVAPRERNLQRAIEKSTGVTIKPMDLPTNKLINERRIAQFKQQITDTISKGELQFFEQLVGDYCDETGAPVTKAAAALAQLVQGGRPFMLSSEEIKSLRSDGGRAQENNKPRNKRDKYTKEDVPRAMREPEKGMERYRLEVGRINGVKPGNIVGAIANEAGIDSQYMGQIQINDTHSFIDLPEGMPKAIFKDLKHTRVCGIPMRITRDNGASTVKIDRNFRAKSSDKPARHKPKGKLQKNKKPKKRARASS